VGLSAALGAVDEPAHVPGGKFPGRAFGQFLFRALVDVPAFGGLFFRGQDPGQQEEKLALYMVGDLAPPLLVAVNSLDGNAQQL